MQTHRPQAARTFVPWCMLALVYMSEPAFRWLLPCRAGPRMINPAPRWVWHACTDTPRGHLNHSPLMPKPAVPWLRATAATHRPLCCCAAALRSAGSKVACVSNLGLHGMLVLEPVIKQQPAEGSSSGELAHRSSPAKHGWFSSGQPQQEQREPPPGAILGYRLQLLAQRSAEALVQVCAAACLPWIAPVHCLPLPYGRIVRVAAAYAAFCPCMVRPACLHCTALHCTALCHQHTHGL
jgi:hypothetical protein